MPDDRPATLPADLYEQDFYLWTQTQAEALRAQGASGPETIDWDRVAEEIESQGESEYRRCASLARLIIIHLHKIRCGRRFEPRQYWKVEVLEFRAQLEQGLTPSVRRKLEAELERIHVSGAREADKWMSIDEVTFDPIDVNRRWTLAQILGEEDDPLPPH